MASSSTIFDLERFDGTRDFSLWKEKMQTILIYRRLDSALEESVEKIEDDTVRLKEVNTVMKQARSAIIMNLADNVLRQVIGEKISLGFWSSCQI